MKQRAYIIIDKKTGEPVRHQLCHDTGWYSIVMFKDWEDANKYALMEHDVRVANITINKTSQKR